MKTFSIQTLGCKVNQYESEQIATLLRRRGLQQVDSPDGADIRVLNSCSVTTEAASKSRQATRKLIRLPLFQPSRFQTNTKKPSRIIVTGCWATSNEIEAINLGGTNGSDYAVLTHNVDVAAELNRVLDRWSEEDGTDSRDPLGSICSRGSGWDEESINRQAGPGVEQCNYSKPHDSHSVKQKFNFVGTHSLPLLDARHTGHQRAFLKIQDGCDARCTYCIIPNLRPTLWSKSIDDAVREAQQLVKAGHREIVLTGIFLGAYGQPTAIRRRQPVETARNFAKLIEALCSRVTGLRRLRLSSLEPLDLTDELIAVLKSHEQVVPHFHLPLQSGSDEILRRMNRQYSRDDYLRMIDRVNASFDRPAITTDIIVAFPGETDEEFARTLDIVDRAKFIHIHAFPFSSRPGTAASRWEPDFISARVAQERIETLKSRAAACLFAFVSQFYAREVELLVERTMHDDYQHGRCERYFDVHFKHSELLTGNSVRVRIDRVTSERAFGTLIAIGDDG